MKKIFYTLLIVLGNFFSSYAQSYDSSILEIRGGIKTLIKIVLNEVALADELDNEEIRGKAENYCELQFQITDSNRIGPQVIANSLNDTVLYKILLRAIKNTEGIWMNHSHQRLLVILPVFIFFSENDIARKESNKLKITHYYYENYELKKFITLPTETIELGPIMHKENLKN